MRRRLSIPALGLLLVLGGCLATIAATPDPVTPREQLLVLEISYQEANQGILDLVAAGILHGEAAVRVVVLLETAREAMRVARAGVDGPNGLALLNAANQALIGLNARLREESG